MSCTKIALAVAIATCCSAFAHAETTSGTEFSEFYNPEVMRNVINGHSFGHADYAIWATDGGTFNLDSATITTLWPWSGTPPQPSDENYDLYGHQFFYVTAFAKGITESEYDLRQRFDIQWDAATPFNFAFKNVDLVTFYPNAFSDGASIGVTNAVGAGITAAVPEPETYAMMLAGLGITALAARRRSNKA